MPLINAWFFQSPGNRTLLLQLFSLLWLATFILYLPAARAGLVGDMPYLFDEIKQGIFWSKINSRDAASLYQIAALHFFILIKLFGTHIWLWHLLYVTMHAFNGLLLYLFFSRLLADAAIKNSSLLSFVSVFLFIICPHASEVVVWEASNHHSVATAIIFVTLICIQQFITTQKASYAVFTALLFFYSSFSHEFFYLTPWFALVLICFYYLVLGIDKVIFRKSFICFFIPLLLLFIFHIVLLRTVKHVFVSHFGSLEMMSAGFYLSRPIKYLFHVILFGRYFPLDIRNKIYALCETKTVLFLFYGILVSFWTYVLIRLRHLDVKVKLLALLSVFVMIIYIFISPVIFADSLLVCYDRYVYPSLGFLYLSLVLSVSFIPSKNFRVVIIAGYALINLWFTVKVNIYWKQSAYVIKRLLNDVPDPGDKTVLLLNLPDNLNGIPMISAEEEGTFKIMRNNFTDKPLNNTIYDVVAYKMSAMDNGAHVMVVNDSVIHITLNEWGNYWMHGLLGAVSYENKDYKVNMIDVGHWYELTLKHPASQYLLLYQAGSQWKIADWDKKNLDQY